MERIKITFKDGTTKEFLEKGRAGGSYTISIRYCEGFVEVMDVYRDTIAFPSESIKEVETFNSRRF